MRDSDWSREILLRSDWSGPSVAIYTTFISSGRISSNGREYLTLKMITVQVVEMSITVNNSPIQDYVHPDDHTQPTCEYLYCQIQEMGKSVASSQIPVRKKTCSGSRCPKYEGWIENKFANWSPLASWRSNAC